MSDPAPDPAASGEAANVERMRAAPPARRSVWTPKQKLVRLVWGTLGRAAWIVAPRARPALLRAFGGRAGRGCRFARSVEITIPWNIVAGDDVIVDERAILYSLGTITLGDGVVVDYRAHLCAGSHDMRDTRFPLTRPPITIGAGSFIGVDAFIGPGVTLGERCRVQPRASVYRNAGDDVELGGNPAKAVAPSAGTEAGAP